MGRIFRWMWRSAALALGVGLLYAATRHTPRQDAPAIRDERALDLNLTQVAEEAVVAPPQAAAAPKVDAHFSRETVGFDWTEQDSVDNRWGQTEIGPFLATTIVPPNQPPIGKGLCIRLGDSHQASVCFDTQHMTLRAAWTGEFLRFDPTRFGLLNFPQIAGPVLFATGEARSWGDARVQYRGLTLNAGRVVISGTVGTTEIREWPWTETHAGQRAVSRTLEVGPCREPLTLHLFSGATPAQVSLVDGVQLARMNDRERVTAAAVVGDAELLPAVQDEVKIVLRIPPSAQPRRFKLLYWSGLPDDLAVFAALASASPPPEDLEPLSQPGPAVWTASIATQGVLGQENGPYVVDTLALPFENPYRALFFVSGHDFFSNGDIALCTVHGDVWRVSGIDDRLEKLVWKRFATGLFQPLGLKVVKDQIYTIGRDQITRLHDRNDDGEADSYECFCNLHDTSPRIHEYVACLEADPAGNFYFLHPTQGLVRITPDGKQLDILATGFRNPNGMSLGPTGEITVSPQEGNWTPASCIIAVRPGGYYGASGPQPTPQRPLGYDPPLCWIPRLQDNSSGGQAWVTSDRWGPMQGQLLHLSYGKCRLMLALREDVNGQAQGGVIDFPLEFESGVMRARFHPGDGQLYVSGLRGWVSAAVQDGCLQRVRYTGQPVDLPLSVRTYQNGLAIGFANPLDPATAEQPDNYHLQQWDCRYSPSYGSPEYRVSDPRYEGRDEVEVLSATLLDERTVFLEIDGMRPAMQLAIGYTLNSAAGATLKQQLSYTLHALGGESIDPARLKRSPRPGQLSATEQAQLRPGILFQIEHAGRRDTRVARLASFYAPDAADLRVTATGYLRTPLKGEYTFQWHAQGTTTLNVNGQDVACGSRVALHKGHNRLKLSYGAPSEGDASLRLMWGSDLFSTEPLPPTVLFCDGGDPELASAELLRHGRDALVRRRCLECHEHSAVPEPAAVQGRAPSLRDISKRLNSEWMFHWLLDPGALRHHAAMPKLFPAENPASRQEAADVAVYLSRRAELPEPQAAGSRAQGETLYSDLGCIACHRLTDADEEDAYDRISLRYLAAKFHSGALASYLRQPHAHYPSSPMPDFQLSDQEARDLSAFLTSTTLSRLPETAELKTADPRRGQALFQARRCESCHAVAGKAAHKPVVADLLHAAPESGCLATDAKLRGAAPEFDLPDSDRQALRALLADRGKSSIAANPADTAESLIAHLRCAACHPRDSKPSPRAELIVEEGGSGLIPESLPSLSWAGEKLKPEWTNRLLAGKVAYRSRPWLKARMPAFPAYAKPISAGLAAQHGIDSRSESPQTIDAELAEVGKQLSLKAGGLDCRQCHAVGSEQPAGDAGSQIALGINFVHVRERLRFDYYSRFVLDPPRYDLSTKMPVLSPDRTTTKVRHILEGNAPRQFEALWHFIHSTAPGEVTATRAATPR